MKQTMVGIGKTMYSKGYEPAYIAGIFANIKHEGECAGYFESSAYLSDPDSQPGYLGHMDKYYNYRSEYSGQNIKDKSLSDVYKIVLELEAGGWKGGFGLGSIQWTYSRTKMIMEVYMETTGGKDTITFDQLVEAEGIMICRELEGYYNTEYIAARKGWTDIYGNNPDTIEAAYAAGVIICKEYERPRYDSSAERGETAKSIYKVMIGQ